MTQSMGKRYRVRSKSDFSRVFNRGCRASDSALTVILAPNGLEISRFGVAVSKRHGNAVKRNRIKRICRAAIRKEMDDLPTGQDIILIPRVNITMTLDQIARSLPKLSAQACAKYTRKHKS